MESFTRPTLSNLKSSLDDVEAPGAVATLLPTPAPQLAESSVKQTVKQVSDPSDAKLFIYSRESNNNPGAINATSGACGLGQALPCSKMPCSLSDYACQDAYFTQYATSRYGSWENARAWWISHSWW